MKAFAYETPASLGEAIATLSPHVRPLAGGTDLVTLMKAGIAAPDKLVGIGRLLPRAIEPSPDGVVIGAAATLDDVARHGVIREGYAALAQAAGLAASQQLRNVATVGGNLLQRPRCWYFRHPEVHCWLKGGAHCPAREGENRNHALFSGGPCVAVHPSDPAAALLAFDADVRVLAARSERRMPLDALFALPRDERRSETTLAHDEIILDVRLPPHPEETRSLYLKAMDRAAFAFAVASVAAVVRLSGERRIGHARLVLGGVAPIPWRARAAEAVLLGASADGKARDEAAALAVAEAAPLARNAWKIPLLRGLVARALDTLFAAPAL